MARTSSLTLESIAQAAQGIIDRGEKPTNVSIREALGGGSMTTISRLFREWSEGQAVAVVEKEVDLPEALLLANEAHLKRIWREATMLAAEGEAALSKELSAVKAASVSEAEKLMGIIEELEGDNDKLSSEVEILKADAGRIVDLEKQLAVMEERLAAAEAAKSTAEQAAQAAQQLTQQLIGKLSAPAPEKPAGDAEKRGRGRPPKAISADAGSDDTAEAGPGA